MLHRIARWGAAAAALVLSLHAAPVHALPIVGDQTIVLITAKPTLDAAGIFVAAIPTAVLGTDLAGRTEALFPITGGDLSGLSGTIEHDGSGLLLSDGSTGVALENFLIDMNTLQLLADVTVDGTPSGNLALFDVSDCLSFLGGPGQCLDGDGSVIVDGFKLSLTSGAAAALTSAFGLPDLTGAQFGVADVDVRLIPEPSTALLLGLGLAAGAARLRQRGGRRARAR
jgi:hypothetical protein